MENEILNEARQATAKVIEEGRGDIRDQVEKIRFELGRQSEQIGRDLATRALGREVR